MFVKLNLSLPLDLSMGRLRGSMLEYIGVSLPPTPHAVLPHDRKLRPILVAFCNVPYVNTSHLNYAITHKNNMPLNFEKGLKRMSAVPNSRHWVVVLLTRSVYLHTHWA